MVLAGTESSCTVGLIWLKDASCSELNPQSGVDWYTAMETVADLAYGKCGLRDGSDAGDWRLPTHEEWEAFVSTDYHAPAFVNTVGDSQWSEGDAFDGVMATNYYWSSTESAVTSAWAVFMYFGGMSNVSKVGNQLFIWPVRSGN